MDTDDTLTDAKEIDWRLIKTGTNQLELPTLKEYWNSLNGREKEVFQRIPFQGLTNYSPKLVSSISNVESVACSSNYMAVLTKSGEVYECGIKEEEEEKNVDPVF